MNVWWPLTRSCAGPSPRTMGTTLPPLPLPLWLMLLLVVSLSSSLDSDGGAAPDRPSSPGASNADRVSCHKDRVEDSVRKVAEARENEGARTPHVE